jgi:hypothetical protein
MKLDRKLKHDSLARKGPADHIKGRLTTECDSSFRLSRSTFGDWSV